MSGSSHMKKITITSIFFFVLLQLCLHADLDLAKSAQDFVLDTKRIYLPEYPYAFNPSIIRWRGSLLMSFRVIPNSNQPYVSQIGVVWLDDDFCPTGQPQLLNTLAINPHIPTRAEDARLILVGNVLYVIFSDNRDPKPNKKGSRMYLGELDFDGNIFSLKDIECLSQYEGADDLRRERNWTPFEYDGKLFLTYSINPHRLMQPIRGTGCCETMASSEGLIKWDWGELRGGTPGLFVEGQYLAFFHSQINLASIYSKGKIMPHYFMGAYSFEAKPPFRITHISPEPIIGMNFYDGDIYNPYWKPIKVVFPGGFIYDDKIIWIVYGKHDHEIWVVKIDKEGLLNSLVPVAQKEREGS